MNPAGDEVERLIDRLNTLREGSSAVAGLVACGGRAIEPLRRFLLDGKPSGIFQPRQRAVEALARLGAKEVLIEYLAREQEIPDPVDRHGEEAVASTAARLLAGWRDEETSQFLMGLLSRKPLPGLLAAMGELRRAEAIPELIGALGDDFDRPFAEEALGKLGEAAHPALVAAARTARPSVDEETPVSRSRRRASLRLLTGLKLSSADWRVLSALAEDRDREIAAHANWIALAVAEKGEKKRAARRLVRMLPHTSWALQIEIERWLAAEADLARAVIDEEIARRRAAIGDEPKDEKLQRLLALKRKIGRKV